MGKKLIASIGQRFGRWTVLEDLGGCPTKWLFLCDCGNRIAVRAGHLRDGSSRSCGCLSVDLAKERMIERKKKETNRAEVIITKIVKILGIIWLIAIIGPFLFGKTAETLPFRLVHIVTQYGEALKGKRSALMFDLILGEDTATGMSTTLCLV